MKFEMFGRVDGTKLNLEIHTAAGTQKQSMNLPENTVLPDTMLKRAAKEGLTIGQKIKAPFFDPTSFVFSEAELEVIEKTTLPEAEGRTVYRLQANYMGLTMTAWIDEEGRTLQEEAANIVTKVETKEQALTLGWKSGDLPTDLIDVVSVKTAVKLKNPRTAVLLKLRVGGIDPASYDFDDDRQDLAGDVVTIRVEDLPLTDVTIPVEDEAYAKYLEATPTIQVNDRAIREKTKEIVGEERNILKAAQAIERWVFETLEKKPLVSIPSARDVLDIKRGDCNEHATLFTALARAAGIPTRIEVGLVYNKDGFYYHAWNSVWVGRWLAVDPTFGQFPADAAHLKVLSGDLDAQIPLMNMIGKLTIDVLEES
ncbi:MAG: transglutaminase-like domain-containing protein [Deltaproteobacteria bacterium]|nr:transglutaminase-like domain-containing protein [Deltaproteobacteria bacterium]